MASSSDAGEPNDAASSNSLTEDTTATKKRSLKSSTGTLTSQSSSSIVTLTLPSSSRDSLHTPPPPLPTLPFELIVEILFKLPVKSLMQFQCVCKSWKSLISDPKFAKKHLHISTKHHRLISTFADDEFIFMDYPLTSVFTQVTATAMQQEHPLRTNGYRLDHIVASCHGILCIANDRGSVLLWNPSIKKFTKLPCFEENPRPVYHYEFGFGYDHSSDSYKVVVCFFNLSVINDIRVFKNVVKVHTLGTSSWRTIQQDLPSGSVRQHWRWGKFVSGTITWLQDKSPTQWNIISLDLEKESYLEIVQPDYGGVTLTSLKLGVLRDCLCIFSRSRCGDTFTDTDSFTNIWLMKEYGNKESWIKLFHVPDIRDLGLGHYPYVCALYVSEDDQVLLDIKSELVVYNSRDGTFKDLNIQNTNGEKLTLAQVYHESLISPCF